MLQNSVKILIWETGALFIGDFYLLIHNWPRKLF